MSDRRHALVAAWLRFVGRYGWRAYALPILAVVTVAALVRQPNSGGHPAARAAARPGSGSTAGGVQVEGLTGSGTDFRAGSTPAPIAVTLGTDARSCATNTYRKLVIVSISKQHLWACEGAKQVNSTPVTTGKVVGHDQTPLGSWRVQDKQRNRYLTGPGYRDYVHYWVPFNGDFGLHDAPWQTMPFGSKDWRTKGSHGCVHVPTATMAWIYRWSQVGSTVVTVER